MREIVVASGFWRCLREQE